MASTAADGNMDEGADRDASNNTRPLTVLLFASAATYAGGVETVTLSLRGPTTLGEVFGALESRFPGFTDKILTSSAVTVDLEYVDFEISHHSKASGLTGRGLDLVVPAGAELAIIPPVSSG